MAAGTAVAHTFCLLLGWWLVDITPARSIVCGAEKVEHVAGLLRLLRGFRCQDHRRGLGCCSRLLLLALLLLRVLLRKSWGHGHATQTRRLAVAPSRAAAAAPPAAPVLVPTAPRSAAAAPVIVPSATAFPAAATLVAGRRAATGVCDTSPAALNAASAEFACWNMKMVTASERCYKSTVNEGPTSRLAV